MLMRAYARKAVNVVLKTRKKVAMPTNGACRGVRPIVNDDLEDTPGRERRRKRKDKSHSEDEDMRTL